ncbi:hypothetical protein HPB50_023544 [Hyalomma asiaticum]|uniref:Uncharacterized protein n=1 Tax=Hyalomma asiaticum TaxID=266040 RepID=A0ACB7TMS1_HYAAI|nr:hypothetical protein HPB50_023544 [Hyalomma asiaticum]
MKSRVARVGKDPCWGSPWPSWLFRRTTSLLPADTRTWITVLAVLFHSTMSAPVSRTGDSGSDHPLWVNPCNLPDDASGHADHLSPQDVRNMLDAVANRARVASEEADKAKRRFVSTRACRLCSTCLCCAWETSNTEARARNRLAGATALGEATARGVRSGSAFEGTQQRVSDRCALFSSCNPPYA